MLQPETVAECCTAMRSAVSTPISIKCRIGAYQLLSPNRLTSES